MLLVDEEEVSLWVKNAIGEGAESVYHSFFPFSIVNQKQKNEKVINYFVFRFFI